MTKRSIQHASADVGIIFTAYNLRRSFNMLDKNLLKAYLKALGSAYSFFQRPFKAIFGPVFSGGLAHGVLSTFYLGCCIAIKKGYFRAGNGIEMGLLDELPLAAMVDRFR